MDSYFCHIPNGNDIFGVRHETVVSRQCIWGLVSPEQVECMDIAARQDMKGLLRTKKMRNIMQRISGMFGIQYRWVGNHKLLKA